MYNLVAKKWWVFLVRGLIAIALGLLIFAYPGITIGVLVIFFGAFAFVDGCFALGAAFSANGAKKDDRWIIGLQGVLGILIGLITLVMPQATEIGLLIAIAAWFMTIGVLQILAAIRLRKVIHHEFWLILCGILSIVCGLLMVVYPVAGIVSFAWLIGLSSLIMGAILVVFSFQVKNHKLALS